MNPCCRGAGAALLGSLLLAGAARSQEYQPPRESRYDTQRQYDRQRPAAAAPQASAIHPASALEDAPSPGGRSEASISEGSAAPAATRPANPAAANPASGNPPPAPAPRATSTLQPVAPFQLSPEQQRFVDDLLAAWEKHSAPIKTFECEFTRWEYRPQNQAFIGPNGQLKAAIISTGDLKYLKPDRGLFHVKETQLWNGGAGKFEKAGEEMCEHWICDGKTVWEIDHALKQVKENAIPLEMQGNQISEGPLPFMLFGGEAAKLKARYFLRERTDVRFAKDEIWLEAYPRWRKDAANFRSAQLIMKRADFLPYALRIYSPNGADYSVYEFRGLKINNVFFSQSKLSQPNVPRGYQLIRAAQQPQQAARQPPQSPAPQ